jgi:serine/threonine protein kinase
MQGTRVGTPLYLSPELVKQQPYDFKVDIWAMGCVLYHIICLQPPFKGDNLIALGNSIVHQEPKPLPSIYSSRLQNFIFKLIAKKVYDRPSVGEVLKLLNEFLKKDQGVSLTVTEEEPTLATNEGIVQHKPQKPFRVHSPLSLYKKPFEQEPAVAKGNAIKIVNQGVFKQHIKPTIKSEDKVKLSPLKNTESKVPAVKEEVVNKSLDTQENNKVNIVTKKTEVKKEPEIINKAPIKETEKEVQRVVSEERCNSLQQPRPSTAIEEHKGRFNTHSNKIGIISRPLIFTYQHSQKDRPTLSMFRDTSYNPIEDVQSRFVSNRPTSAIIPAPQKFSKKLPEEMEVWERPQSAMPIGKGTKLPALSKSICQT